MHQLWKACKLIVMGVEESDRLLSELSVELYIHELAYREGLG